MEKCRKYTLDKKSIMIYSINPAKYTKGGKMKDRDIEILIKNYEAAGFSVRIQDDYLIVEKPGLKQKRIKISTANKLMNAVIIEKH